MIGHFIQDLVACFFGKNQRLVLRIFTGKYERGETIRGMKRTIGVALPELPVDGESVPRWAVLK